MTNSYLYDSLYAVMMFFVSHDNHLVIRVHFVGSDISFGRIYRQLSYFTFDERPGLVLILEQVAEMYGFVLYGPRVLCRRRGDVRTMYAACNQQNNNQHCHLWPPNPAPPTPPQPTVIVASHVDYAEFRSHTDN